MDSNKQHIKRGTAQDKECKEEETVQYMLFECKLYDDLRYSQIKEGKESLSKLILNEEHFQKFTNYANNILEKRKTYLNMLNSNGSASTRLGTGNGRVIMDDPDSEEDSI